jgi:hypothetical protein
MHFLELEFKHKAKGISLRDFKKALSNLMKTRKFEVITGKSPDFYYSKRFSAEEFYRYRAGDNPELTKKIKLRKKNNWVRIEVDLPLDEKRISKEIVESLMNIEGYKFNFSIIKTFHVIKFKEVNYVFYTVYGPKNNKLGAFIEVEINKEKIKGKLSRGKLLKKYMKILNKSEKVLNSLNLNESTRLNESIFEMYRKF